MSTLDRLDKQLIKVLGQDALKSSDKIAKQLGVSTATVRRRIKKLIENKTLHIIGVVDPVAIGLSLNVIIGFKVAPDQLKSVLDILVDKREVSWVATTTGRFDILARGRFVSTTDFSRFLTETINGIKGIVNYETFMCLDVKKGREIPPPPSLVV